MGSATRHIVSICVVVFYTFDGLRYHFLRDKNIWEGEFSVFYVCSEVDIWLLIEENKEFMEFDTTVSPYHDVSST